MAPQRSALCAVRTQRTAATFAVVASAVKPTVADTKSKFIKLYTSPLPALYNTVIQEFLVQSHLMRFNSNYTYDPIMALGFVSVYDQTCDGLDDATKPKVFKAYIEALEEDPATYRADAEKMQALASSSSAEDLKPDASGNALQQALAKVAAADNYYYTKWFAIGLFRMLELAGATEPKALETLVASLGVNIESVNRDLMMYKGVLSKMTAAKELMEEMMAREKKKQAERDAAKAAPVEVEEAPKAEAAATAESQ